ncbi:MAG: histidine ammonia-lyase [Ignavibacteriaceae bacterium]
MNRKKLIIDGKSLTLDKIRFFLEENPLVVLSKEAEEKIIRCRKKVEKWLTEERVVYGVTTGFGSFANIKIPPDKIEKLQQNLIESHSAGVGEQLPPYIVKLMMLLRANALSSGYSGIRLETVELLISMLNLNIIPVVPSQGSVGSSGDLAPLSHLVLAMTGNGKVQIVDDILSEDYHGLKKLSAGSVLNKFRLKPVRLKAKEGLALINGTQMMTAFAAFICIHAKRLVKYADISAAMSHEALRASDRPFDSRIHKLRPMKGQVSSAKNILRLIKNSGIRKSHLHDDPRVQDAYSTRCIPQVHGATRDAVDYVCSVIETELNSVNDNPLIFPEDDIHLEGGNFHGQPVALAMDFMAIALAELADISERRIERMTNGSLSGLPPFLTSEGGINSGFMILQYTAASLVSENKVLAHPASVDSIPTSANQEDINSMGSIAARKCLQILKNVQTVIALEMITAAQGIDFLKPLKCGIGTGIAYREIRKKVKPMMQDRYPGDDIQKILKIIREGNLLKSVESKIRLL